MQRIVDGYGKNNFMKQLEWLIVGGSPRSGTTALGEALNQSEKIALFHEYASHKFFSAIDGFFEEEDRMRSLGDFEVNEHLIPTRSKYAKPLAKFLFCEMFGKNPQYIGTKFPGYQAWQKPKYPNWITPRYIHITRNPFDVIISVLKKDCAPENIDFTQVKNAFFWWIDAWNYAIAHADDDDFHHIFYDDIINNHQQEKIRVADFLGVSDFSFDIFKATHNKPIRERYHNANLEQFIPFIESVIPLESWGLFSQNAFKNRQRFGFPLKINSTIDLSSSTDDYQYYASGFYPAEENGAWTCGEKSEILFTPTTEYSGPLQISFEVIWSATLYNEPRDVELILDNNTVFSGQIGLGSKNGKGHTYSIYIQNYHWHPMKTTSILFYIKNPVNPFKANISDDNRDIGLMIKNITISSCC